MNSISSSKKDDRYQSTSDDNDMVMEESIEMSLAGNDDVMTHDNEDEDDASGSDVYNTSLDASARRYTPARDLISGNRSSSFLDGSYSYDTYQNTRNSSIIESREGSDDREDEDDDDDDDDDDGSVDRLEEMFKESGVSLEDILNNASALSFDDLLNNKDGVGIETLPSYIADNMKENKCKTTTKIVGSCMRTPMMGKIDDTTISTKDSTSKNPAYESSGSDDEDSDNTSRDSTFYKAAESQTSKYYSADQRESVAQSRDDSRVSSTVQRAAATAAAILKLGSDYGAAVETVQSIMDSGSEEDDKKDKDNRRIPEAFMSGSSRTMGTKGSSLLLDTDSISTDGNSLNERNISKPSKNKESRERQSPAPERNYKDEIEKRRERYRQLGSMLSSQASTGMTTMATGTTTIKTGLGTNAETQYTDNSSRDGLKQHHPRSFASYDNVLQNKLEFLTARSKARVDKLNSRADDADDKKDESGVLKQNRTKAKGIVDMVLKSMKGNTTKTYNSESGSCSKQQKQQQQRNKMSTANPELGIVSVNRQTKSTIHTWKNQTTLKDNTKVATTTTSSSTIADHSIKKIKTDWNASESISALEDDSYFHQHGTFIGGGGGGESTVLSRKSEKSQRSRLSLTIAEDLSYFEGPPNEHEDDDDRTAVTSHLTDGVYDTEEDSESLTLSYTGKQKLSPPTPQSQQLVTSTAPKTINTSTSNTLTINNNNNKTSITSHSTSTSSSSSHPVTSTTMTSKETRAALAATLILKSGGSFSAAAATINAILKNDDVEEKDQHAIISEAASAATTLLANGGDLKSGIDIMSSMLSDRVTKGAVGAAAGNGNGNGSRSVSLVSTIEEEPSDDGSPKHDYVMDFRSFDSCDEKDSFRYAASNTAVEGDGVKVTVDTTSLVIANVSGTDAKYSPWARGLFNESGEAMSVPGVSGITSGISDTFPLSEHKQPTSTTPTQQATAYNSAVPQQQPSTTLQRSATPTRMTPTSSPPGTTAKLPEGHEDGGLALTHNLASIFARTGETNKNDAALEKGSDGDNINNIDDIAPTMKNILNTGDELVNAVANILAKKNTKDALPADNATSLADKPSQQQQQQEQQQQQQQQQKQSDVVPTAAVTAPTDDLKEPPLEDEPKTKKGHLPNFIKKKTALGGTSVCSTITSEFPKHHVNHKVELEMSQQGPPSLLHLQKEIVVTTPKSGGNNKTKKDANSNNVIPKLEAVPSINRNNTINTTDDAGSKVFPTTGSFMSFKKREIDGQGNKTQQDKAATKGKTTSPTADTDAKVNSPRVSKEKTAGNSKQAASESTTPRTETIPAKQSDTKNNDDIPRVVLSTTSPRDKPSKDFITKNINTTSAGSTRRKKDAGDNARPPMVISISNTPPDINLNPEDISITHEARDDRPSDKSPATKKSATPSKKTPMKTISTLMEKPSTTPPATVITVPDTTQSANNDPPKQANAATLRQSSSGTMSAARQKQPTSTLSPPPTSKTQTPSQSSIPSQQPSSTAATPTTLKAKNSTDDTAREPPSSSQPIAKASTKPTEQQNEQQQQQQLTPTTPTTKNKRTQPPRTVSASMPPRTSRNATSLPSASSSSTFASSSSSARLLGEGKKKKSGTGTLKKIRKMFGGSKSSKKKPQQGGLDIGLLSVAE